MLADLGIDVSEAGSEEEALPLLEQSGFDILVTNLGLPGMSGDQFCQAVRQCWPEIGIVFATGASTVRNWLIRPEPHY
uniref:response regulator n=1 Tax=Neorhizobium sp. EC2-8 TaxID=3129230 RepID=UPI00310161F7